jgi:hypothetical protein
VTNRTVAAGVATLFLALAGLLALAGCGPKGQAENAAEFRDRLEALGYELTLLPEADGRPGQVAGVATTEDGVSSKFAFSFGPAPEPELTEPADSSDTVWITAGDEFLYWMSEYPRGLPPDEDDRLLEMRFAIEDAACRVVAGRNCGP